MSFWTNLAHKLDRLLGEPEPDYNGMDPDLVEEAVRLIQTQMDADRGDKTTRRLRVSDLSPERRQELTAQLARLVKEREARTNRTSEQSDVA
jgi:hypothetical protein